MRLWVVGIALMLTILALLPASRDARADTQFHVFQISCLPDIDRFEIRELGYFDKPRGLVRGTAYDLTTKGDALYSPEWIYHQPDKPMNEFEEKFGAPPFAFYATRFECKLRTEAVVLVVLPHLAHSYEGTAGDISVTLGLTGRWVIEGLPFNLCEDRGPITRLFYDDDKRIVGLEGRFGGVWPDKVSSREASDSRHRRYTYHNSTLALWDPVIPGQKDMAIPLRSKDIDYFQDPSNSSYGVPVSDCY